MMGKLQTRAILSLRSLQWDDEDIAIVLGLAVSNDAPQKPILGALSEDEIKRRSPQKPEELVDALNDPIHLEVGRSR